MLTSVTAYVQVTLIEKETIIGGKAATVSIGGKPFDLGGHVCTVAYTAIDALAKELGLGKQHNLPNLMIDRASDTVKPVIPHASGLAPLMKKLHEVSFSARKLCLGCSMFGPHNIWTSNLHMGGFPSQVVPKCMQLCQKSNLLCRNRKRQAQFVSRSGYNHVFSQS